MITHKQYKQYEKQSLSACKKKIKNLDDAARIQLAKKSGLSLSGLLQYLYGNGKKLETALRILEG